MKVLVGYGSCGIAAGADDVYTQLESWAEEKEWITLQKTGCIGLCYLEPIVDVYDDEYSLRRFVNINPEDVPELIDAIENRKDFHRISEKDQAVLDGNANVVTQHCGVIDPECIEDYINASGYEPLKKVLTTMTPEQLIEEVQISGLRGRGGAGFPTWFKWEAARKEESDEKYVVCNADEGDPGAFMDRSLLEGDPHRILEGMLIAGYAIGAKKGIIYARAEYPLAISRVTKAIEQARERGFLGEHIMGTDFSFDIIIKEGAGAFVCGEETALISSLEGKRGIPSLKPPYPAQHGYLGKPTNINNVETLANIPWIILYGGKTFAQLGTSKSTGTKVFALTGKLKHGGLVEVPMGTTLRKIIFDIGGGIKDDHEFKAVQLGGPSGGCIPAKYLDTPVDYESVNELGAIMGSGGMVVMDDNTCMVEIARYFLDFIVKESCGKCTPCRIGNRRILEILEKIVAGKGTMDDLALLEELCHVIKDTSLCGLGQSAPNPVLSTLHYFMDEYKAHVLDRRCPAGVCKGLLRYYIKDDCIGCGLCKRHCPIECIYGKTREIHYIDQDACIRCGECFANCPVNSIEQR